jgi:cyclopropane-fatty-acyl-phospholipid synthase
MRSRHPDEVRIEHLATSLAKAGVRMRVEWPGRPALEVGPEPPLASVHFHEESAVRALLDVDHLRLAEAYLDGDVDVEGDLRQVIHIVDHLDVSSARWQGLRFWLRIWLDRKRFHQETVAFHYEQSPGFFLPWLGKHRCYTHGFYESAGDGLEAAHERKLRYVLDALDLQPGMRVLDVGLGWGAFVEFAAERGIEVHGITLAEAQMDFVANRLRERDLAGSVECVDFADHVPASPYDAVVFMGSLEHIPDYRHVSRFLTRHLTSSGRVYADFVSSSEGRLAGAFLRRHVFPGASSYVDKTKLVRAFRRAGLAVETESDDTESYAHTVRDWAQRLDAAGPELEAEFGQRAVRTFALYLWSAHHFLESRRTTGWHLVASRSAVP